MAIGNSLVPVSVHGFSATSAMVAVLNLLVGGGIVALIKIWPKLKELGNTRRKDEMDALRHRVDDLERQIETLLKTVASADERAHQAEMRAAKEGAISETKISRAATAVTLVIGELERMPGGKENPVIKQARELIAMAATGDSGFGMYITQLAEKGL